MPSTQAWRRRGAEQFVQLHTELGSQDAGSAASSLLCLSLQSSAVKCSERLSQALTSTRQGAGAARSSRSSPHPAACHPPPGSTGTSSGHTILQTQSCALPGKERSICKQDFSSHLQPGCPKSKSLSPHFSPMVTAKATCQTPRFRDAEDGRGKSIFCFPTSVRGGGVAPS